MVTLDGWIMNGCLWMVPFLLVTSGYGYYFYSIYLLFRRYKYGYITVGQVIRKWMIISSSDTHKTTEYHLAFAFDDKRQEINDTYLPELMDKYISKTYINHFPKDIVNLCTEYIGNTLTFYYGPYYSAEHVTNYTYDRVSEGDSIKLKYDPKYPQNVQIYDSNRDHIADCFVWSVPFICISSIFFGVLYGLNMTLHHDNTQWKTIMFFIFVPSIVMPILVILFCSFKKGVFCFRENLWSKLQFINDIEDTEESMETSYSLCTFTCDALSIINNEINTSITVHHQERSETSVDTTMTITNSDYVERNINIQL